MVFVCISLNYFSCKSKTNFFSSSTVHGRSSHDLKILRADIVNSTKKSTIRICIINDSVVDDLRQSLIVRLEINAYFTKKTNGSIELRERIPRLLSWFIYNMPSSTLWESLWIGEGSSSQNCDGKYNWTFLDMIFLNDVISLSSFILM